MTSRKGASAVLKSGGGLLALALAGSWRPAPPPLAPVEGLVPPDAAEEGLLWWRARRHPGRASISGPRWRRTFLAQWAATAHQAQQIREVVRLLDSAGVAPLLVKGWASARHYAHPGLRPLGDIDLCIASDQLRAATEVLIRGQPTGIVDLHTGVPDLTDRPWETLVRRAERVQLAGDSIVVLGAEDHLRLICLHAVRHGLRRPLWLCDVAAALERIPSGFDCRYFLSGDRRLTGWVRLVLGLAQELLGAVLPPALEGLADQAPTWLIQAVLGRWTVARSAGPYLRDPSRALRALHDVWLNPVIACHRMRMRPNHPLLRFVVQLGDVLSRPVEYPGQIQRWFHWRRAHRQQRVDVHRHDLL